MTVLPRPAFPVPAPAAHAPHRLVYLLDRATGGRVDRLRLPDAPERITRQGTLIRVRTYDHVVTARLKGA